MRKLQVLVIEDNPHDFTLLCEALTDSSFRGQINHAKNLARGIQALNESAFDAILVDLSLPDAAGEEVVRQVVEIQGKAAVVVLTGRSDDGIGERTIALGAQDFVQKGSLEPESLARSLRYAIQRRHMDHLVRASEERFALATEATSDAIWDWDVEADAVYLSQRWYGMLGKTRPPFLVSLNDFLEPVHQDDRAELEAAIRNCSGEEGTRFEREYRMLDEEGRIRYMRSRWLCERRGDVLSRVVGAQSDITTERLIDRDTGLPTRAILADQIDYRLSRPNLVNNETFIVLLAISIDNYQEILDGFGAAFCKALISVWANHLLAEGTEGDVVCRLDGPDFAMLLECNGREARAFACAERLRVSLQKQFALDGQAVSPTASIGVAFPELSDGLEGGEQLVHNARIAAHEAGRQGGDRIHVFESGIRRRIRRSATLVPHLRAALRDGDFGLWFSPVCPLAGDNRVTSYSARLCWNHQERGLLFEEEFLADIAEWGLISELWTCVASQIYEAKSKSTHDITLMLPNQRFLQPSMLRTLTDAAAASDQMVNDITIALSEDALLHAQEEAKTAVEELQDIGIQISVCRFGTGGAGLLALDAIELRELFIDATMLQGVEEKRRQYLLRHLLEVCKDLGTVAIAQGINDARLLDQARRSGFSLGEGSSLGPAGYLAQVF